MRPGLCALLLCLCIGCVPGPAPTAVHARSEPAFTDRFGDGTPDFLRLDTPSDREAWITRFTWLAESQAFTHAPVREVTDCSSLLRFAYREAARELSPELLRAFGPPPAEPPAKYRHPETPVGLNLFRVKTGPFVRTDAGAFAQFADAETLMRLNTHAISREVERAAPGDLLFFRQSRGDMPWHVMVFVGRSHFDSAPAPVVVYHTGPEGADPGEIRRPAVADLMRHPDPRWRPFAANPHFLGVRRWNILREAD